MSEMGDNSKLFIEELADKQQKLLARKSILAAQLKEVKKEYDEVSQFELPTALKSMNLTEMTLSDGRRVVVTKKLSCRQKNDELMARWYLSNGGDPSKVKRGLTLSHWGPDTDLLVEEMQFLCREKGVEMGTFCTVTTASVKSLLNTITSEDNETPDVDGMSVSVQTLAEIS